MKLIIKNKEKDICNTFSTGNFYLIEDNTSSFLGLVENSILNKNKVLDISFDPKYKTKNNIKDKVSYLNTANILYDNLSVEENLKILNNSNYLDLVNYLDLNDILSKKVHEITLEQKLVVSIIKLILKNKEILLLNNLFTTIKDVFLLDKLLSLLSTFSKERIVIIGEKENIFNSNNKEYFNVIYKYDNNQLSFIKNQEKDEYVFNFNKVKHYKVKFFVRVNVFIKSIFKRKILSSVLFSLLTIFTFISSFFAFSSFTLYNNKENLLERVVNTYTSEFIDPNFSLLSDKEKYIEGFSKQDESCLENKQVLVDGIDFIYSYQDGLGGSISKEINSYISLDNKIVIGDSYFRSNRNKLDYVDKFDNKENNMIDYSLDVLPIYMDTLSIFSNKLEIGREYDFSSLASVLSINQTFKVKIYDLGRFSTPINIVFKEDLLDFSASNTLFNLMFNKADSMFKSLEEDLNIESNKDNLFFYGSSSIFISMGMSSSFLVDKTSKYLLSNEINIVVFQSLIDSKFDGDLNKFDEYFNSNIKNKEYFFSDLNKDDDSYFVFNNTDSLIVKGYAVSPDMLLSNDYIDSNLKFYIEVSNPFSSALDRSLFFNSGIVLPNSKILINRNKISQTLNNRYFDDLSSFSNIGFYTYIQPNSSLDNNVVDLDYVDKINQVYFINIIVFSSVSILLIVILFLILYFKSIRFRSSFENNKLVSENKFIYSCKGNKKIGSYLLSSFIYFIAISIISLLFSFVLGYLINYIIYLAINSLNNQLIVSLYSVNIISVIFTCIVLVLILSLIFSFIVSLKGKRRLDK